MEKWTQPECLKETQFRDGSNLNARIELHRRFSTNPQNLFDWVFDFLDAPKGSAILELGSGTGLLWASNLARIGPEWRIILSDLSDGMVEEARGLLRDSGQCFSFKAFDAQSIPFEAEAFDVVIANHMLYYLPDIDRGLREIHRVLRPGGVVLCSSVSIGQHMAEVRELVRRHSPEYRGFTVTERFCMENGEEQLGKYFSDICSHRHVDSLKVTDADLLLDYVMSSQDAADFITGPSKEKIKGEVTDMIEARGFFEIHKLAVLFEGRKPAIRG